MSNRTTMRATARPLAALLALVCACTETNSTAPAAQATPAATARPDPWARAPAAEGQCPWAGLRFRVGDFVPAPESYSTMDGSYCINYSDCEWNVEQDATGEIVLVEGRDYGEVKAPFALPEDREFNGTLTRVRVHNGWLIGIDRGEFGGHLYWFSFDGQRHVKIADELNIMRMFEMDGKPYAITSMTHMGASEGTFVRLRAGGRHGWTIDGQATLPRAPLSLILQPPHSILVIDDQGIYTLDLNGSMKRTYGTDWRGQHPHSAEQREDGSMVLGGRHVIIDLQRTDKGWNETMMVPPACTTFRVDYDKTDCICG